MSKLVVYDSLYGNTQSIAVIIGEVLTGSGASKILSVNEVTAKDMEGLELLIVGSPTQGGRPTELMQQFLKSLADQALTGIKVATFDTRFLEQKQNFGLKMLMKTIGYAAPKIATELQKKGGELVQPAEGFIVEGKEGPLAEGEAERARTWALQCVKALS